MSNDNFTYWKKPGLKWVFLTAGILQGLFLYEKIKDYQIVIKAGIFSDEKLIQYMAQQKFSCLLSSIAILGFLGVFLIGSIAKSTRSAKLAEALLLIAMAAVIGIGSMAWGKSFTQVQLIVYLVLSILAMGTGLFTLIKYMKK